MAKRAAAAKREKAEPVLKLVEGKAVPTPTLVEVGVSARVSWATEETLAPSAPRDQGHHAGESK
jgi:hypothetical protein